MAAPSDANGARVAPGRSTNDANRLDPQSANSQFVTITEDTQQPSITKLAQQPGRPTSICKRRLSNPHLHEVPEPEIDMAVLQVDLWQRKSLIFRSRNLVSTKPPNDLRRPDSRQPFGFRGSVKAKADQI